MKFFERMFARIREGWWCLRGFVDTKEYDADAETSEVAPEVHRGAGVCRRPFFSTGHSVCRPTVLAMR